VDVVALTRRDVFAACGAAAAGVVAPAEAEPGQASAAGAHAVLVDTTACIGCRKCEWACNQANGLPSAPVASFEDTSVFASMRRPDAARYTVVNRFPGASPDARPAFVKVQCMHCVDPACCSACLVGALEKRPDGAVTYDPSKCMGCRYCMVVCPFQVPAYEYGNAFAPQVRKCTFCHQRVAVEGKLPACVEICPPQCLTFGSRGELLAAAHERITSGGSRYVRQVYGEREVGGTSWLYLAGVGFPALGFPSLGDAAPPRLTETLQHGVFRDFVPPLALFGVLAAAMRLFPPDEEEHRPGGEAGS
jgi:formate dehydrogenase iron-sulfur subunit